MDQKRTIEEVLTIYSLEPNLKDIYVEGWSDKRFVEWFLYVNNIDDVHVYSIDIIDIPSDVLHRNNLTLGSNRSEVFALASELAQRYPDGLKVLCMADRDFEDYHHQHSIENTYLILTDCNSLELYAFTPQAMRKFTSVALGGIQMCEDDLIDKVVSVLEKVYACRLANELLGWNMVWLPFTKCVDIRGCTIIFKDELFIKKYLQKNNRWNERNLFMNKYNEALSLLLYDPGRRFRGHDLCELLLPIFRKMQKDRKFGNVETLEGCLMATVECRDIERMPFFQRILSLAREA